MNKVSNRIDKLTFNRIKWVFFVFVLAASLVVGQLANYQIAQHEKYQSLVMNQVTVQTEVTPERGRILDRNGNVLAANKTVYDVILSPHDIKVKEDEDLKANSDGDNKNDIYYRYADEAYGISYEGDDIRDLISSVLAGYTGKTFDHVHERSYALVTVKENGKVVEDENGNPVKKPSMYALIQKAVEGDVADRIKIFIDTFNLKNLVYFEAGSKRYYPKGDLAAHVIGFTNADGVGVYGLEAYYNNVLEGTSGRYFLAQDSRKNDMPFEYERFVEASNGYDIVTTLDIYIQYELENQLEKTFIESGAGNRVTGIVIDVNTGGILAMATYPSFDLNDPRTLDEYSQAELDAMGLTEGSAEYDAAYYTLLYKMWNNKAITETYEPGSTFKIITTSMAFEDGKVTPEDGFYCSGSHTVEGWPYPIHCHKNTGHGAVSFRYGLQQSCNPVLMMIADRVGRENFYYYFGAFGYREKTGIDLPAEASGIYSTYKDFSNVSLAVYSFGQTFKTTPIQQIRAISAVANGGNLLTPHLLNDIVDGDGNVIQSYGTKVVRQAVSEATCDTITEILEEGVATDGGAKNAYVKGFRVAAKTGTSEKRDEYDENGNTPYRVGSCVAYAPADDPQVAALIVVDKPLAGVVYGSSVAAPYISNLLGYVLPYIGVEPQYTTEELAALDVTLSNYVGATVENSKNDLSWRQFEYEIVGDGDTVTAQIPEAGSKISSDTGLLILYTGDAVPSDTISVPNLVGASAFNANNLAVSAGLNVTFKGSVNGSTATVINQTPEAGTMVTKGTIIEIELRHLDGTD